MYCRASGPAGVELSSRRCTRWCRQSRGRVDRRGSVGRDRQTRFLSVSPPACPSSSPLATSCRCSSSAQDPRRTDVLLHQRQHPPARKPLVPELIVKEPRTPEMLACKARH
eukprot:49752-Hanusia_phi.AAC.1